MRKEQLWPLWKGLAGLTWLLYFYFLISQAEVSWWFQWLARITFLLSLLVIDQVFDKRQELGKKKFYQYLIGIPLLSFPLIVFNPFTEMETITWTDFKLVGLLTLAFIIMIVLANIFYFRRQERN
ncbi:MULTISPECIES: hypothetical protein [Aerococcus]|uniref:Uncharacterized protein n=2 Tax=Aerococcus TaxID=1375 RepID=A0A5N1GFX5_9LACT|nr:MULTISPECIES: hypothetical protein [Aerococcus]KAA9299284.1 hypothetical protein F6I03_09475 [Aerococcus sanguinicola]MDK6370090.1 hypothetical protein [Aerococcus sp. UMB9870]MDK6680694.1 hypothetical protein [Aerococcus sp. UMB8608]MDK6940644.1 hypothetical protein [Aerococcus sp. UMB8487]OFK16867.1 hypothetical protein HMPREF2829_04480 [Aerococcus sp. HMSC072A12]